MLIAALCFDGVEDEVLIDVASPFLPFFSSLKSGADMGTRATKF